MDNTVKNILVIFFIVLVFYLLKELSFLLIPLALALLLATIVQPLIQFLINKKTPRWLILPSISIITLGIFLFVSIIIIRTTTDILSQQEFLFTKLDIKLKEFLNWINSLFGSSFDTNFIYAELIKLFNFGWITTAVGNIASSIGSFTGSFVMFALYYVFLLSGMSNYKQFLNYVAGTKNKSNMLIHYEKVQKSVFSYMILKTLANLMTAIIVSLICWAFGIKFVLFWGLIAFLMGYIPTFGSIIAVILPMLMGFIQFDNLQTLIIFVLCLQATQFIMGNFIEPKVIGDQLRLNTVTVLFGLVFWGYIWGLPGMILSVPLLVIIKLTFSQFNSLALFSRIMGYPEKT